MSHCRCNRAVETRLASGSWPRAFSGGVTPDAGVAPWWGLDRFGRGGDMLYSKPVFLSGGSRVARVVAIALLTWTAADLINSRLCALDQWSPSAAQHSSFGADTPSNTQIPTAPDDCFCCSHDVQAGANINLSVAEASVAIPPEVLFASVLTPSRPLYHPPQPIQL